MGIKNEFEAKIKGLKKLTKTEPVSPSRCSSLQTPLPALLLRNAQ